MIKKNNNLINNKFMLEKKLKEECGVFAICDVENAPFLTYNGLHVLQHRGQDAAGIAWLNENNEIICQKNFGLVDQVFGNFPFDDNKFSQIKIAIGHVRYATFGNQKFENIQPFIFQNNHKKFALAHNGNISNYFELKVELEKKNIQLKSESDSELIGQLLLLEKSTDMLDALVNVCRKLEGAFSLVLMEKDNIYAARDKIGFRPLVLGKLNNKYIIASESVAFDMLNAELIRNITPGEIVKISQQNISKKMYFDFQGQVQLDAMELIYFARPDSIIDNVNVHIFRKKTGKLLWTEKPEKNNGIIVPVPDSAFSAALGYAEASGYKFELGLIKNRYITRTFIQPNQIHRELNVLKKLNVSKSIVKGKNIILVDDSIVRGTTIKKIIKMLKKAGALNIYVKIASPKIIAPSYYGINIATYDELISHHFFTEEKIAKYIGATSVQFLSIEGLKKSATNLNLETCIFTNKYQTHISPELLKRAKNEK